MLVNDVIVGFEGMMVLFWVVVMGCVVNGLGEVCEVDLGVVLGNGKGQIFVKGEVIKMVFESEIVVIFIEEVQCFVVEMLLGEIGSFEVVMV